MHRGGSLLAILLLLAHVASGGEPISRERAIEIATKDAGGFLGTWVHGAWDDGVWHVSAFSKSAKPPVLYVVDGAAGKILYRTDNSDEPATVRGRARDANTGALLVTSERLRIHLQGLARWPAPLHGQLVVVKGQLSSKPVPGDATGEHAQLVVDAATYALAR